MEIRKTPAHSVYALQRTRETDTVGTLRIPDTGRTGAVAEESHSVPPVPPVVGTAETVSALERSAGFFRKNAAGEAPSRDLPLSTRTRQALDTYQTLQSDAQQEARTVLHQILGVDFYA